MARMTGIERDSVATGQPGSEPGRAYKDQRRRLCLDAQTIERFPGRMARRQSTRTGDSEPNKPRAAIEAAAEFGERRGAELRLKVHPIADDHIGISLLGSKAVVVNF